MGSPLRILHVVVNMNRGGAEMLLMNLYRNIDREKVQFDFLTCRKGVFDQEITMMGGRVYRIPYVTEIGQRGFSRELRYFLSTHSDYKVIHSHLDKMSGLVLWAAKKEGVPIRIAHSHNTESEGNHLVKMYKWYIGNYVNRSATHLYACSDAAAKWLFGHRSSQAELLKNGIDTDKFQFQAHVRTATRQALGIAKDAFVIGHVGRFSHQKNHMFLLNVFARVHKEFPFAVLLLVGDGELRDEITERIKALNIQNQVKILGVRADIPELLQAFDVFVFPSFHEGLPVTLVEAQGAGLPCIISDRITEEVDMGMGLVQYLPITEQSKWVHHMVQIIKKRESREISQETLLKRGYDIKQIAKKTESSYLMLEGQVI